MDPVSVSGAIASTKAALDIVKTAFGARDDRMLDKALADINSRLLDVLNTCFALQEKNVALMHRVAELEREKADLEAKETDAARYELHRTVYGGVCFRLKPSENTTGQPVYLCAACMGEGKKAYLQSDGNQACTLSCPHGHPGINSDHPEPPPRRIEPDPSGHWMA